MTIFYAVVLLVITTIFANIVYTLLPKIPLAFYQIGAGLVLSFVPMYHHFNLDPSVFMLIIIAPLMFEDGQNANTRLLRRSINSILSMAVLLVMITIGVVGLITHSVLLTIPLPLAFALAAIITPTDAVAVSSVTTNLAVPNKIMTLLKNEALFNDASGIVAFDLALTAFTSGQFSLGHGVEHFLIVFLGGLLVGLILGYFLVIGRIWLVQRSMSTAAVVIPYSILTPFLVYVVAEELGLSGILAAVAAGLVHGVEHNRLQLTSTHLQIASRATWSILTSILNGIVFVLLGVTLPTVLANILSDPKSDYLRYLLLAVLLYVVMTLMRYLWIRFGFSDAHFTKKQTPVAALIGALSGIHGTVTLSMAFSLPLFFHGAPFPFRNVIIFIASIVIIISLLVPTLVLPLILPAKELPVSEIEFAETRRAMVNYAIQQLLDNHSETLATTQQVVETLSSQVSAQRPNSKETEHLMRKAGLVESDTINNQIENGEIPSAWGQMYERFIIINNYKATLGFWGRVRLSLRFWARFWTHRRPKEGDVMVRRNLTHHPLELGATEKANQYVSADEKEVAILPREAHPQTYRSYREFKKKLKSPESKAALSDRRQAMAEIETDGYNAVMTYLGNIMTPENVAETSAVRRYYNLRHRRMTNSNETNEEQNDLFIQAFQYEYNYIQAQLSSNKISKALANQLYEQVSTDELVYMQQSD
ncbi:cation:proton antiporter [Levilactobacillus bambusae]|uniref:Na+/H+ antiporter n=1 Tax=Levilactobacillus bambusae TaxID=2024736 RepID=A0A2V1MYD6_9LACO|nr:sodium:proton antiporter [Levilactobacillus bambusae]PWF99831.1 Na+/H+ antiporter [Levilactobacillus bambusae]